ncbi:MAG TPA: hypothetical protein VIO61_13770 [Anaerolineaceae bacterium]
MNIHFLRTIQPFLVLILLTQAAPAGVKIPQKYTHTMYIPLVNQATTNFPVYFPLISKAESPLWMGPSGGSVVALAAHPTNPNILYAGSWGADVFKTTNGGTSWFFAGKGINTHLIDSLAIDPVNPDTVYAGTHHGGVYKTMDGGGTWTAKTNGMQPNSVVYTLAVNKGNPNLVYAGTRGEAPASGGPPWRGVLYKSINGGESWYPVLQNIGGTGQQDWVYSIAVDPNNPNLVLAASHEHGIYRSTDYGETWKAVSVGDGSGRALAIDPRSGGADYYAEWHQTGVFKSTNNGKDWESASGGLSSAKIYPNGIAIALSQPNTIFMADFNYHGVWKTTNAAGSWSSTGLQSKLIYSVAVNPSNSNIVLAGTVLNGILRSTDGGTTWVQSDAGITNTQATGMVFPEEKTVYASVYGSGVWKSTNSGATWTQFNTNLGNLNVLDLVLHPTNNRVIFALTEAGLYQVDSTSGSGWVLRSSKLPMRSSIQKPVWFNTPFDRKEPGYEFIETTPSQQVNTTSLASPALVMAFSPSNPNIAYLGTGGVGIYKSSDGGNNWSSTGLNGTTIVGLAIHPTNPYLVFAATNTTGEIKMTANGGNTWTAIDLSGQTINALMVHPDEPDALYAATSSGVWKRTGGNWSRAGLDNLNVTRLSADLLTPRRIYAGTTSGAYRSDSKGTYWDYVTPDLNNTTIQAISYNLRDPKHVYFHTTTHGTLQVWVW